MVRETERAVSVPWWAAPLLRRIAAMQAGRVYNVIIVVPYSGAPEWSVLHDAKLETPNERKNFHD